MVPSASPVVMVTCWSRRRVSLSVVSTGAPRPIQMSPRVFSGYVRGYALCAGHEGTGAKEKGE